MLLLACIARPRLFGRSRLLTVFRANRLFRSICELALVHSRIRFFSYHILPNSCTAQAAPIAYTMTTTSDPPAAAALPAEAPKTESTATTEVPATEPAEAPKASEATNLETTTKPGPAASTTTAATSTSPTRSTTADSTGSPRVDIPSKDGTNPLDFQGDVQTNNNLPSQETLRKLEKYTVLDESGKSHTFKSLYTGPNVARRVLIIFIRHFFCGVSALEPLFPSSSFFSSRSLATQQT